MQHVQLFYGEVQDILFRSREEDPKSFAKPGAMQLIEYIPNRRTCPYDTDCIQEKAQAST